ncbi:hypothetical protein AOA80_06600 [Methanomassiliicoccales archaeon RumEn M1]|jgi:hypothetical protein|nr:hypothetical protein AOA80_06600 [Methanomassiliicoccales archaeon RumEn M1]
MSSGSNEGDYCGICGGISPAKVKVKQIEINGKLIGIDGLDEAIAEVRGMGLTDDATITEELLKRVKRSNYVPTGRVKDYGEALLKEFKKAG